MDKVKDIVLSFLRRPESLLWSGGVMVFFGTIAVVALLLRPGDAPVAETPTVTPTRAYPTPSVATFTPAPQIVLPSPTPLPVTNTPGPVPTRSSATTHIVASGDTLLGIALEYDVTVDAIKAANEKTDDLVYEGEELTIPVPEALVTATPLAPGTGIIHKVAEGETLGGIALDYDVSTEAILAANNLDPDDFIYVGQELVIPSQ